MEIVRLHIAKSSCYPTHGIICEYDNGHEAWDCDCAADSEEVALGLAAECWPDYEVVLWDNPLHYSHRRKND